MIYKIVVNKKFHSEFIINGDGKFLNLLDEDATQDAILNCASFNYASENDSSKKNSVHDKLDGNPAKIKMNEPKFREDSYFVKALDNNSDEQKKFSSLTRKNFKDICKKEIDRKKEQFENRVEYLRNIHL